MTESDHTPDLEPTYEGLPTYQPGNDCEAPARAFIGGHRIPIIEAHRQQRKQGALAVSRFSEVAFPAVGPNGKDFASVLQVYEKADDVFLRPTEVQFRDYVGDQWVTAHRGVITGYGGHHSSDNAMRFTVMNFANFLGALPASTSFNSDASIHRYLEYVADELESGQPVFDDIHVVAPDERLHEIADTASEAFADHHGPVDRFHIATKGHHPAKRFAANRDTLQTVTEYIQKKSGVFLWFEPSNDGSLTLVASATPPSGNFQTRSTEIKNSDGELDLIHNEALFEIGPFTSLELRGEAAFDVVVGPFDAGVPGSADNYPHATATHVGLRERAGGTVERVATSSTNNLEPLKRECKKELKRQLDGASGGTMESLLAPHVTPYSTIRAKPTCLDHAEVSAAPVDYEVESTATHVGGDDEIPKTELRVSLNIDINDIEITSSGVSPT